jgi:hypothetical protein
MVEFVSYSMIGITAYFLLVQNIDKFEIDAVVISSIPIPAVTIGKFMMLGALFFAVPLNMYPARDSLFEAAGINK